MIEDGRTVSLEFTLKLDDGTVAESNVGGEALQYVHGQGQMLPGLEQAITGLTAGDSKDVTLAPAEGFGDINPEAFQAVPLDVIPEDARSPGAMLVASDESGNTRQVRIREIQDDQAIVDLNHPLAGQTLHFSVKVLNIE